MSFRENILHLRSVNNLTQEQLAVYVGVSRQSVAKWESGKAYPEIEKLIKLSQIFNCTIDDLVKGDLTGSEPNDSVSSIDTAQDLFGYDDFMRGFAKKISNGVMFTILGVAFGVLCFSIADNGFMEGIPDSVKSIFDTIGVICVLTGTAFGLVNIIPAGLDFSSFVREHPYLEDFYTKDQKRQARKSFSNQLIAGIICFFVGVCLVVAFSMTASLEIVAPFCLLALTAVGVRLLINGGMTLARVDIRAYNAKAKEVVLSENQDTDDISDCAASAYDSSNKSNNRIGAWCGIVMMIATMVAFVMLFVPEYRSELFWLAWPIGGLVCGIVALLFKAVTGED